MSLQKLYRFKGLVKLTAFFAISLLSFRSIAQDADQYSTDPAVIEAGKALYESNCVACHKLDAKIVGPALGKVTESRTKEWLISWIRNPQAMIDSGDEDAVALAKEYPIVMNSFENLSDEEITSMLAYFASSGSAAESSEESVSEEVVSESKASGNYPSSPAELEEGLSLFEGNCAACHAMERKLTGPALAGVTERRKKEWLVEWIKDPKGMIDSGDPIAKKLYNEYKPIVMNSFGSLSDDQILNILGYIESYVPPVKEEVASAEGQGEVKEEGLSLDVALGIFVAILLVIIVLLIVLISSIKKNLSSQSLSEDDQAVLDQKFELKKVLLHPAFIGILVGIASLIGLHFLVHDGLYGVGVQKGYAPEQPIKFSHKKHVGEREIDCNYCHTGVRKAKHANIPSANICMNCHSQVKTDSPEIQKIYKALDYDPKTREYGDNVQPIKWVRIHNLPDLVYFNHSQHVKVGGIECETCHGPIEEMEVVRQYSTLTMGWCIDCHRETAVNSNNPYYEKLLEEHESGEMTVEDIGGTECGKCHY